MVKFAVNTFLFASRFTDEGIGHLSTIRDLGFEGVELTLQEPLDFDRKRVLQALKEHDLVCCSLCGIFGPGRDLRGTPEEREASKAFIKTCIDMSNELECELVSGPLYSRVGRARTETEDARQEQWQTVAEALGPLSDYAAQRGVRLAIEPLLRFETDFINTCQEALDMVAAVGNPALGVHLDTFHMNTEEQNPTLAIVAAGDRLFNVHAADNTRGAPGTGTFDWKGFRDALAYIQYDHYVIIEAFHPDTPEIAAAAAVRKRMERSNSVLAKKGLTFLKALFAD